MSLHYKRSFLIFLQLFALLTISRLRSLNGELNDNRDHLQISRIVNEYKNFKSKYRDELANVPEEATSEHGQLNANTSTPSLLSSTSVPVSPSSSTSSSNSSSSYSADFPIISSIYTEPPLSPSTFKTIIQESSSSVTTTAPNHTEEPNMVIKLGNQEYAVPLELFNNAQYRNTLLNLGKSIEITSKRSNISKLISQFNSSLSQLEHKFGKPISRDLRSTQTPTSVANTSPTENTDETLISNTFVKYSQSLSNNSHKTNDNQDNISLSNDFYQFFAVNGTTQNYQDHQDQFSTNIPSFQTNFVAKEPFHRETIMTGVEALLKATTPSTPSKIITKTFPDSLPHYPTIGPKINISNLGDKYNEDYVWSPRTVVNVCPDPKRISPCKCFNSTIQCSVNDENLLNKRLQYIAKLNTEQRAKFNIFELINCKMKKLSTIKFYGLRFRIIRIVDCKYLSSVSVDAFKETELSVKTFYSINTSFSSTKDEFNVIHALRRMKNLVEITLKKSSITQLGNNAFGHLSSLTSIDLSGGDITRIHALAFERLPALRLIDLSSNKISLIEDQAFTFSEMSDNQLVIDLSANLLNLHSFEGQAFDPIKRNIYLKINHNQYLKSLSEKPFFDFLLDSERNNFIEMFGISLRCNPINKWILDNKSVLMDKIIGLNEEFWNYESDQCED